MRRRLPYPEVRMGSLAGLPYETVKWELLRTAVTLGVFDCLSTPNTAGDVFLVTCDGLSHDKTGPAGSVISWLSTSNWKRTAPWK
ncbi:MAG TPA: hypothetical protein VLI39_07510 [Sedimentisphaerales bacterium]|nr:hypothetical protein [Sedimentisphaerales bacterium]